MRLRSRERDSAVRRSVMRCRPCTDRRARPSRTEQTIRFPIGDRVDHQARSLVPAPRAGPSPSRPRAGPSPIDRERRLQELETPRVLDCGTGAGRATASPAGEPLDRRSFGCGHHGLRVRAERGASAAIDIAAEVSAVVFSRPPRSRAALQRGSSKGATSSAAAPTIRGPAGHRAGVRLSGPTQVSLRLARLLRVRVRKRPAADTWRRAPARQRAHRGRPVAAGPEARRRTPRRASPRRARSRPRPRPADHERGVLQQIGDQVAALEPSERAHRSPLHDRVVRSGAAHSSVLTSSGSGARASSTASTAVSPGAAAHRSARRRRRPAPRRQP